MRKISQKFLLVILSVVFLFGQSAYAGDWEEDTMQMAAEVVYRPAGVILLAGGTATFVVLLPFSLLTGTTRKTAKTLVKKPYQFTFVRPVGSGVKDWGNY